MDYQKNKVDQKLSEDENKELNDNTWKLVSTILNSKKVDNKTTKQLEKYHTILEKDFLRGFAEQENTMTSDATAYKNLQEIEKELSNIVYFPMLFTKSIIAVVGCFSSGKSKFLNTLIEGKAVELSVGIKPVTAIPTFLMCGEKPEITAYTPKGEQAKIEANLFNKIDHAFIENLGFNLKTIMPYVTVATPFEEKLKDVDNLCIIDTPGYDAMQSETTADDYNVTFDVLQFAQSVLFFIPCDKGTINDNDIEFLQKMNEQKKRKIYIVISKADRAKSTLQDVIDDVKDNLDNNGIEYEGISAFSSKKQIEYYDENNKTSLYDFLLNENKNVNDTAKYITEIKERIEKVFDSYHESIAQDNEAIRQRKNLVKKLQFNYQYAIDEKEKEIRDIRNSQLINYRALQKNLLNKSTPVYEEDDSEDHDVNFMELTVDDVQRKKNNEENNKEAYRICTAMTKCVDTIFAELNMEAQKKSQYKRYCEKCGYRLTTSYKYCPKCGAPANIL